MSSARFSLARDLYLLAGLLIVAGLCVLRVREPA
jgi:hypothetical protein